MKFEIREIGFAEVNKNTVLEGGFVCALRWLGQAGFEFYTSKIHILIDPYLSDHLAKKYAGKEFAHQRMMTAPLKEEEISELDYILCTHRHSDHIDPETVPVLLENNSAARMLAPRAEREYLEDTLRIDHGKIIYVNAGDTIDLNEGVSVKVIPASHEEIKIDSAGNHHYIGYIVSAGGVNIYHSGDCVPYDGQAELLRDIAVDVALLPVNGRDEFRANRGVPGNMNIQEALELCRQAKIGRLICHHFGMFSFNTVDPEEVKKVCGVVCEHDNINVYVPDTTKGYAVK